MQTTFIQQKIFKIREQKVVLDFDLADWYDVETKILNKALKRNIDRFPKDYMFRLTKKEWNSMSSQFVSGSQKHRSKSYLPFVFTEHGVTMLASVLRSNTAVKMNIAIVPRVHCTKKICNSVKRYS